MEGELNALSLYELLKDFASINRVNILHLVSYRKIHHIIHTNNLS